MRGWKRSLMLAERQCVTNCLNDQQIYEFVARSEARSSWGGLRSVTDDSAPVPEATASSIDDERAVQAHIDECPGCRAIIAELLRASRPDADAAMTHRGLRSEGIGAPGHASSASLGIPSAKRDPSGRPAPIESVRRASYEQLTAGDLVARRFVLIRPLGEGAMGVVWAARDHHTESDVALKFLRTPYPEHVRRLMREAHVLEAIRHENVVAVREVVQSERFGPVLAMDLLRGRSLEALLSTSDEHRMAVESWAPIALGILRGLRAAHAAGVIHRDLKPHNVFVESEGPLDAAPNARLANSVRVLDFGMAKLAPEWQMGVGMGMGTTATVLTRSGAIMGTPLYMAPEQIFGERDIDARADLWSFGVMSYRALTGRLPVTARSYPELARALATHRIEPIDRDLPPLVRSLMGRLLALPKEARCSSVDDPIAVFESVTPRAE